jgi:hypothetical protein
MRITLRHTRTNSIATTLQTFSSKRGQFQSAQPLTIMILAKYFLNLFEGGKDTEICEFYRHHKCLEYATKVASNERQIDVNCDLGSFDYPSRCNCLPPCNEITYDYETFDSEYGVYNFMGYGSVL